MFSSEVAKKKSHIAYGCSQVHGRLERTHHFQGVLNAMWLQRGACGGDLRGVSPGRTGLVFKDILLAASRAIEHSRQRGS